MKRGHVHHGFTLLELVLVLVVICAITAIAVPSLRGWREGARLRDSAGELVAMTRWARSQAVTTATVHRLEVDAADGTFRVTMREGETFSEIKSDFGRSFRLPSGLRIALTNDVGAPAASVDFYPTGRTQPARATLRADDGRELVVECRTAAEEFRIVANGGGA